MALLGMTLLVSLVFYVYNVGDQVNDRHPTTSQLSLDLILTHRVFQEQPLQVRHASV